MQAESYPQIRAARAAPPTGRRRRETLFMPACSCLLYKRNFPFCVSSTAADIMLCCRSTAAPSWPRFYTGGKPQMAAAMSLPRRAVWNPAMIPRYDSRAFCPCTCCHPPLLKLLWAPNSDQCTHPSKYTAICLTTYWKTSRAGAGVWNEEQRVARAAGDV